MHAEIIKLIVAYTLLGALVFTVIITCLSLIGLVKFAVEKQQSKLFGTLIVQLVVIGIGGFSNTLKFDAGKVEKEVQRPAVQAAQVATDKLNTQVQLTDRLLLTDQIQEELLKGLKPKAAKLARQLMAEAKQRDIDLRILSGFRSAKEQDELYEQGRTKPGIKLTNARGGFSISNTGLAFDVGIFRNGRFVNDDPAYNIIGEIGKKLGLIWGGDRQYLFGPDPSHFETADAQSVLRSSHEH